MTKIVLFFMITFSSLSMALVPLEGLLYGDVKDTSQLDPLKNIHSETATSDKSLLNDKSIAEFKKYLGLYRQGSNLVNSCQFIDKFSYASKSSEIRAKRVVASTLQYIGLDFTIKAIAKYFKLLEYSKDDYKKLTTNLIKNSCSKNISVYSIKLLRRNFEDQFNNTSFKLPTLNNSPYFSKEVKELTDSRQAKKHELDLTIRNFRSLCSWNSDVDDYRVLVPLLNSPFVMSYIFNHLLEREIDYNKETGEIFYANKLDTIKMKCDGLICRKTTIEDFKSTFPRMIGSSGLASDFEALYCKHFKNITYNSKTNNKTIAKWIKQTTIDSPYLEATNFLSLITKKSDLLIASKNYNDLEKVMALNIKNRWNKWATEKTENLVTDLLFEESLNVDLVSKINTASTLKGDFGIDFDFSLGEADKVLNDVDKISSFFNLAIPINYLRWMRKEYIARSNLSDYKGLEELEKKNIEYIASLLKKKEKYFLIPLWNNKIATIITRELRGQLVEYKGSKLKQYTNKSYLVPIKFKFGLFALKYLNDKFKAKYRSIGSIDRKLIKKDK